MISGTVSSAEKTSGAAYLAQLERAVATVLMAEAVALQTLARRRAARRSGRLRRSIDVKKTKSGKLRIGTDLAYGAYLEFGTRHIRAHPWLMPAVEQIKPQLKAALKAVKPVI